MPKRHRCDGARATDRVWAAARRQQRQLIASNLRDEALCLVKRDAELVSSYLDLICIFSEAQIVFRGD